MSNPVLIYTAKVCPKCGVTKPLDEFHNRAASRDGRHSYCKPCNYEVGLAWQRANRERSNESKRRSTMRQRMGVTQEQYDALLAAQGGVCAVCARPPSGKGQSGRRLNIDHDHRCCSGRTSCGRCVRGLLCWECNVALGKLDDDPTRLRRAADYVEGR